MKLYPVTLSIVPILYARMRYMRSTQPQPDIKLTTPIVLNSSGFAHAYVGWSVYVRTFSIVFEQVRLKLPTEDHLEFRYVRLSYLT